MGILFKIGARFFPDSHVGGGGGGEGSLTHALLLWFL